MFVYFDGCVTSLRGEFRYKNIRLRLNAKIWSRFFSRENSRSLKRKKLRFTQIIRNGN